MGVNFSTPPGGICVQTTHTHNGVKALGGVAIPNDNTIPQITEGTQFMSHAHTPKKSSNNLEITVVFQGSTAEANKTMTVALFRNGVSNALAASSSLLTIQFSGQTVSFKGYLEPAGGVTPITFTVRAGLNDTTNLTFNGYNNIQALGGVMASSITVKEFKG